MTAATAYDDEVTGTTYILILGQAIFFGDRMKNIWIIGSSHGVKIGAELGKVIGDQQSYTIRNFSKSGAKFENLIWPNPNSVGSRARLKSGLVKSSFGSLV